MVSVSHRCDRMEAKEKMVNVQLLRGKIEEKGINVAEVATQMGMDKATLYRRLSNSETFTIGEVGKIAEILHLTHAEAVSIFFNHNVA